MLTDRLRLIGFGAEVLASSRTLTHVQKAHDAAAQNVSLAAVADFGTRHRSAFRFCWQSEDFLAFVMSQDGGIKAVKRCGPNVLFWQSVDVKLRSVNFEDGSLYRKEDIDAMLKPPLLGDAVGNDRRYKHGS